MEKMSLKPTQLIIHGHFYQPPRENPLVDIIPKQASAKPYNDWNERIYDDCYRANAYSRYLNNQGKIEQIINNYEYISFNFGPTLLKWIAQYHAQTYQKILDADAKSLQRLGHGNAIAQAYNHTILPLNNLNDMERQVVWGIKDFEARFNRYPEGLWLSETAINSDVIDVLAKHTIKFVILSPWQCKAIEGLGELSGDSVPYSEPFIIEGRKGGQVAAFFYHGQLASAISFGHMLRDADAMYQSLVAIRERDQKPLIHTATDGEIYGHHEPFGDMALAALTLKVHNGEHFEFSNYGAYLAQNSPTRLAILQEGEGGKGSSWSCIHGVSRWYKDCGCHTGGEEGWNQKWRTPLRKAFDILATQIDSIFAKEMVKILPEGVESNLILDHYSLVSGALITTEEFIATVEEKYNFTVSDKELFCTLLEGMRFKHYMYTSCGWFFSDLAGIEPQQNIHYAVRSITLYQRFTALDLFGTIEKSLWQAHSNRPTGGNGKTIAKSFLGEREGAIEAAVFFLINQILTRPEKHAKLYGSYRLETFKKEQEGLFTIAVCDLSLTKVNSYKVEVDSTLDHGYSAKLEDLKSGAVSVFTTTQIPERVLDDIYRWIDRYLSIFNSDELRRLSIGIKHYLLLTKKGRLSTSQTLYIENMGSCLRALRSLFTTNNGETWQEKRESISLLLTFIRLKGRSTEQSIVQSIFSEEITRIAHIIGTTALNYELGSYLLALIEVAQEHKIRATLTIAQEALYPYFKEEKFKTPLMGTLLKDLRIALNFAPFQ
ncbi:MAG: DUF3536 domain-containing protein [Sphaerochaetaceae bacterium]